MIYEKLVKRATLFAVFTAATLIAIKLVAWWSTGAVSLMASLFDSGIDMLASGVNFLMVRYALLPADRNHSFGHGKAESLAALGQSAFVAGSAVFLVLASIKSILHPIPLDVPVFGIIVTLISLGMTFLLMSYQYYVIRQTKSQAICADRLHYQADMLTNGAVLLALILSWYGFYWADGVFALIISGYILYNAFQISRIACQSLLDKALPEHDIRKIEKIARSVTHVKGVHDIRTRQSGKTTFIQLHLEFPDNMSLIEAHTLSDGVMMALNKVFPNSDITIHQDPVSVVQQELTQGYEMSTLDQN